MKIDVYLSTNPMKTLCIEEGIIAVDLKRLIGDWYFCVRSTCGLTFGGIFHWHRGSQQFLVEAFKGKCIACMDCGEELPKEIEALLFIYKNGQAWKRLLSS